MIPDTELGYKLSTGRVRARGGSNVVVALDDTTVTARVAVPLYQPGPGDEVLIALQDAHAFVIGVLDIAGTADMMAPTGLRIRSAGDLDLVGGGAARLTGTHVSIRATTLNLVARTVSERFEKASRWVRDCFQLRAGRTRTDVTGTAETQAGRIVCVADGAVRIDGESIDLG